MEFKPQSGSRPSFKKRPFSQPEGHRRWNKDRKPSFSSPSGEGASRPVPVSNEDSSWGSPKRFEKKSRFDRQERNDRRPSGPRPVEGGERSSFGGPRRGDNRGKPSFAGPRRDREEPRQGGYFKARPDFTHDNSGRGPGASKEKFTPSPSHRVVPVAATQKTVMESERKVQASPSAESQMDFSDFDLPQELEMALADANFTKPTPIQEQSLPHTLGGFDLIGCAQTGTGKTAAFVIPMVTRLLQDEDSQALVLAPTRELAAQILETLRNLTGHARHLRHTLIIGGAPMGPQIRALRSGVRIIVATPGRLVDHLEQKVANLSKVKFFVLDEADRMFDMGFAPQIDKIVRQIPKDRQTLLFSATFSKEVKALAVRSLKNPKEVFVGAPSTAASGVEQESIETTAEKKFEILLDELNKREGTVLLFTGMKYKCERLAKTLEGYGHKVSCIHGGRTMGQRKSALQNFRDQYVRILVATDIAARGLDISHVAHVINYDLPKDPEDYIHRIGRTARAGAVGKALSFITRDERDLWKKITKMLEKNK